MEWTNALEVWMGTIERGSQDTARAYRTAVEDYLCFAGIGPEDLGDVGGADVAAWANDLAARGLARATIKARLAALSAFYRFCLTTYTDADGVPLATFNPVDQVKRPRVAKYGNSRPLELDQLKALLDQIDTGTVQGLRDKAMILFAVYTGRRSSELRELTVGNIVYNVNGTVRYSWVMKKKRGHQTRWDDLPTPVYQAIRLYWDAAGRGQNLNEPVFVAHNAPLGPATPLSSEWFNSVVQFYARAAGLPEWVHAHTLRHTASYLRLAAGRSVLEISRLLGHSSLQTTQVYVQALAGFTDEGWQDVERMLT
jgi:site-specific recombinase XerD